jgi:general stress protein YciG
MTNKEKLSSAASEMGRVGGKSTGGCKVRGDYEYYSKIGRRGLRIRWEKYRQAQADARRILQSS